MKAYESRPQEHHRQNVVTYEPVYRYDDQERYRKNFEREYQSYKRMYSAEQEHGSEDQFMNIESGNSDKHQSPQLYTSKHNENSFIRHNIKHNISNIDTKPTLAHSSSNNRLRYKVDIRTSPRKYTRDTNLSSNSHITRHYNIIKPSTSIDLQLNYKQQSLTKSNYDHSSTLNRYKNSNKTLTYNAKPIVERRYDPTFSKIIDSKKYNDYFRPNESYQRINTTNNTTIGRKY